MKYSFKYSNNSAQSAEDSHIFEGGFIDPDHQVRAEMLKERRKTSQGIPSTRDFHLDSRHI